MLKVGEVYKVFHPRGIIKGRCVIVGDDWSDFFIIEGRIAWPNMYKGPGDIITVANNTPVRGDGGPLGDVLS